MLLTHHLPPMVLLQNLLHQVPLEGRVHHTVVHHALALHAPPDGWKVNGCVSASFPYLVAYSLEVVIINIAIIRRGLSQCFPHRSV